jgi:di/tricarboxylate transporter
MNGKKELNSEELSDAPVKAKRDKEKYVRKKGLVTLIEGIFQGIAAIFILLAIINDKLINLYDIAMLFNIIWLCFTFVKLWNKSDNFDWIKLICYSIMLCGWILTFAK